MPPDGRDARGRDGHRLLSRRGAQFAHEPQQVGGDLLPRPGKAVPEPLAEAAHAHAVIDGVGELESVVDEIEGALARGERP